MKNLKENDFMQEMSMSEMENVNGGIIWGYWAGKAADLVLGLMVAELFDKDAFEDFENGRIAARNFWGV